MAKCNCCFLLKAWLTADSTKDTPLYYVIFANFKMFVKTSFLFVTHNTVHCFRGHLLYISTSMQIVPLYLSVFVLISLQIVLKECWSLAYSILVPIRYSVFVSGSGE